MPSTPHTSQSDQLAAPTTGRDLSSPPDLDLSDDEKRVIKAQQVLNNVADLYDEMDRNEFDGEMLSDIQNMLSEAALLLTLAGYDDDSDEVSDIKDAIRDIERYLHRDRTGADTEDLFIARELAYNSIYSASHTDPMRNL